MPTTTTHPKVDPPTLVAIAIAARKAGDRRLEQAALRELRNSHGIRLAFAAERQEAPDA
jgi:hypothetical protein